MLNEAKRLYALGWGVHWLEPLSKVPLKDKWTTGPRDDWATLERLYKNGERRGEAYGLGVRMGEASALPEGGYLANIDVDIKSGLAHHKAEALAVVEAAFPGLIRTAPIVQTGYGFRLFVRTATPIEGGKLARSDEHCLVMMRDAKISGPQRKAVREGIITEEQLAEGLRVRPAWEVEFMSQGRQVVLPPSTHPETGKLYVWKRSLSKAALPLVTLDLAAKDLPRPKNSSTKSAGDIAQNFVPVNVDLVSSTLPDAIYNMITDGEGADDRSAACYKVAIIMAKHGFTDVEIMSVLTDESYYLGETSFDHSNAKKRFPRSQQKQRQAAAVWIAKYCIRKMRDEVVLPAEKVFAEPATPVETLEPAAAKAQAVELLTRDFRSRIKRPPATDRNPDPKPDKTLENTVTILEGEFGSKLFRLNTFTSFETYGVDVPWPRTPAALENLNVTDACVASIKLWLGRNYRYEPTTGTIEDAIKTISVGSCYHPVIEEFEALPPWDGVERVDTWLKKYWGAEGPDEYLAQVFRKWLLASVTRTYRPGSKFDWMPILEGTQGHGKQTFFAVMFGQRFHSDNLPSLHDKDSALNLEGLRVQEFGELETLGRNEIATVKSFLSRLSDKVRRPYGRRWEEIPRSTVFCGSTNVDAYLKDETGNRRFNPIKITRQIDFKALHRDRDQLWAEILFIHMNGLEASLDLDGEALDFALQTRRDKLVEDESSFYVSLWETFVARELTKPAGQRFDFTHFKMADLFDGAFGPFGKYKADSRSIQFAGKALRAVGAVKTPLHGRNFWCFEPSK